MLTALKDGDIQAREDMTSAVTRFMEKKECVFAAGVEVKVLLWNVFKKKISNQPLAEVCFNRAETNNINVLKMLAH